MNNQERRLHRRLAITNLTLVIASVGWAIRSAQVDARANFVLSLVIALLALVAGVSDAIRAAK